MKLSRENLKKIGPIYRANAYFKSKTSLHRYENTSTYYHARINRMNIESREEFLLNQLKGKVQEIGLSKRREGLKILYVGTDYYQDYSGIIQGLQKFGEVFTYEHKPGAYGQKLRKKKSEDFSQYNGSRLFKLITEELDHDEIDIVIGQMWASSMNPSVLKKIQMLGIPVVNISMDDRHAFGHMSAGKVSKGTSGLIGSIDLACTAAKECRLWYIVEGCPSIYLPEASDPEIYKPLDVQKEYDVLFVGANYGVRREIVRAIEKEGVNVTCYGHGWPNGRIDISATPRLFAESRIILGIGTIGHCKNLFSLKMRDFDGPMSGSLYITHDNEDLYDLYEVGKEIVTYRNPKECAEKIRYYLNNYEKAEEIAHTGRLRAEKYHTWEMRFKDVFEACGIL